MKGNRFTQIYTLSPHASAVLDEAPPSPDGSSVQRLDYYGRQRASGRSGDFFLLIPRASGLVLCMGSVPGEGADSALLRACLEIVLRSLEAQTGAKPASIAQALNQFVHGAAGNTSYATLFYACIDPMRGRLLYVNAGHEPALLFRKRQARAIRLENTGAVLGLTRRSNYGQRAIPLEPGDLLAVFSEGVAETRDILGRPFGSEGVLSALRRFGRAHAADLVDGILAASQRHAGWSEQCMDRTVAVVRYTGNMWKAVPVETKSELSFAAA